jgi:hypothetical protein
MMKVTAAILGALARAARRNLGSFASLKVNNFFLFVLLMAYGSLVSGLMPVSAYPFLLVVGLLMLGPLSSDPLSVIPASRRALWPLRAGERLALRLASFLFSPVSWIAIAIVMRTSRAGPAILFGAVAIGLNGIRVPGGRALRWIPRAPGRCGELCRNHARQMFFVLDTYLAIVIGLAGAVWRTIDPAAPPEAAAILAILVVLALSTQTQCLFSLDGAPGAERSRLLPLPGWQVIAAKDVAWLSLVFLLALPLDAVAGLTFGLWVLATGHSPSLRGRISVERWRFAGGEVRWGLLQCIPGIALASAARAYGPAVLAGAAAVYAISLARAGKYFLRDTVMRQ